MKKTASSLILLISIITVCILSGVDAVPAAETAKTVLLPIAEGFEDMEAVVTIDILRRAGAKVTVASVGKREVVSATGLVVKADKEITECADESFDMIALPGGMPSARHLHDSETLKKLLVEQNKQGKPYAAICAAPAVVLEPHGLLAGKRATCWPGLAEKLSDQSLVQNRVVQDKNCITSQGPGTVIEFALKLVEALYGAEKAVDLKKRMLIQ
jgi:4-methyl-5(b-hydroxyethyl)-thiazole monophosphate biosynthesis